MTTLLSSPKSSLYRLTQVRSTGKDFFKMMKLIDRTSIVFEHTEGFISLWDWLAISIWKTRRMDEYETFSNWE